MGPERPARNVQGAASVAEHGRRECPACLVPRNRDSFLYIEIPSARGALVTPLEGVL